MGEKTQKSFSRTLRRNQTEAEKRIWSYLRSREFQGIKFRRQQPLGPYVVDFCSFQKRFVIELDGGQHALTAEEDARRTEYLEQSGYRVIRVWNNEALNNTEAVLEYIRKNIGQSPLTLALSRKGRGKRA